MYNKHKWTAYEFSNALQNAIQQYASPNLLRTQGNKILFNGFWRDGNKQNVCFWPSTATWHDAKTGEGGGCKEFAEIAFKLPLPGFMDRFGPQKFETKPINITKALNKTIETDINKIFEALQNKDKKRKDHASDWLTNKRGFENPKSYIGSGYANICLDDLLLFVPSHQRYLKNWLSEFRQMAVPLRGVHSDKVKNLFLRSIDDCPKNKKSRLLPGVSGWHEPDATPRAFGFPHLIKDFPNLILCEGMADYFACEILLEREHNFLPIGAASASALSKWAEWLTKTKYKGQVILLNQLDKEKDEISSNAIGQKTSIQAMKIFLSNDIKAKFFAWHDFLCKIEHSIDIEKVSDVANIYQLTKNPKLSQIFLETIQSKGKTYEQK